MSEVVVPIPQKLARLRWRDLYREVHLYKAAVRLYTKPLFYWWKALAKSTDGASLYDFARRGLHNLDAIHRTLKTEQFVFRPAVAWQRNFNGKHRTLYIFPWEERIVDLLLYRLLNEVWQARFSRSSYAYRVGGFGVDRCQREIAGTLRRMGRPLFVMKRDIVSFFDSMDHAILLEQMRGRIERTDYLFRLVEQRVRFEYVNDGCRHVADRGVPFGSAFACLAANIHLSELDRRLEQVPGVRFFRYADDLLVLSEGRDAIAEAAAVFDEEMARLKLQSKPCQEGDFALAELKGEESDAPSRARFRHLGLEFRADGSVGLSRDKFRKICNLFRYAFRRRRRQFQRIDQPLRRAKRAVQIACETLDRGVRNVAIIDYYLRHVNDEAQIRRLDRWLAEEVLHLALGQGHKKGWFRRLSFRQLRAWGLPSLVHRRRLILHGRIESPFFLWKHQRTQRSAQGDGCQAEWP